jgi:hypothetical protein
MSTQNTLIIITGNAKQCKAQMFQIGVFGPSFNKIGDETRCWYDYNTHGKNKGPNQLSHLNWSLK